jgi:hypothetical protein
MDPSGKTTGRSGDRTACSGTVAGKARSESLIRKIPCASTDGFVDSDNQDS